MRTTITPELARKFIEKNTNNRPISNKIVSKYVNNMKKGTWKYNGESIKISSSGVILDGQHRLHAIIKSSTSIDTEIIYDIPSDCFGTIDIGKTRTSSDLFAISKIKSYRRTASIVNGANAYLLQFNDNFLVNRFFESLSSGISNGNNHPIFLRDFFIADKLKFSHKLDINTALFKILKHFYNFKSGSLTKNVVVKPDSKFPYDSTHTDRIFPHKNWV